MSKSPGQWIGTIAGGVIGSFFGMPALGASIGGMIGGMIDPPKGPSVTGPRLEDQSFTSSTLGAALARGYGTFPVSGNVIWLEGDKYREVTTTESQGGKGGGGGSEVTSYTYYATFAVSLLRVTDPTQTVSLRRLWIGSNLVYDAGSDNIQSILASNNGQGINFTFYSGSDDQAPNPRWQADKGVNAVSGYPGRCYIVIEDLDLTKYGNSLAMAQIKAELVVGQATPDADYLIDLVEPGSGGITNAVQSVRIGNGTTVIAYTCYQNWDYDITGNYVVTYEHGVSRDVSGPYTMPVYASGSWEAKLPLKIDQSDANRVAWILNHSAVPFVRIVLHAATGELIWDTGNMSPSPLPYQPYHACIEGDELTLAYPGEKIYVVSPDAGIGRVTASSASTFNIRRIGLSENYIFGVDISGTATSLTVYRIARDTLTLSDTYTATIDGRSPAIHVVSDDEFYTLSTRGGPVWRWVSGVAEDTGLTFIDDGTRFDHFAVVGDIAYVAHNPTESQLYEMWLLHKNVPAANASLRDIVTAECGLAGVASADIDLTALTDSDVRGYRITERGSVRAALEPLQAAFPFDVAQSGYKLRFVSRGGSSVATIPESDLGTVAESDNETTLLTISREMDTQLPRKVSVKYLDVDREYDTGEQYAERPAPNSVNERIVELPMVMNSSEAAQTGDVLLSKEWVERVDLGPFSLPPTWRALEAADVVTVQHRGQAHVVRLTRVEYLPDGRITCNARLTSAQSYTSTATGAAPAVLGQSLVPLRGTTTAYLLDIPRIRAEQDSMGMAFGLLGLAAGWPGGALLRSDDSGNTWTSVGAMNSRARVFIASDLLAAHHGYSIDNASVLTVIPHTPGAELYGVTEEQLYAQSNMAAYGADGRWEIVSFRSVTDNTGSFTLKDFLRGLYGTEWTSGMHAAGDVLVMLDTATVGFFGLPTSALGTNRLYRAVSQGSNLDSATNIDDVYDAFNLKPLSPVDISASRNYFTLDWTIGWERRTRQPVEVFSGVSVPLGESSESYVIEIWSAGFSAYKRTLYATSNSVAYTSAQQIADFGVVQEQIDVIVKQVSSVAGSGFALSATLNRYAPADPYGAQVVLLMHMDDTGLTDVKGHIVTLNGNAARSATQSKFGGYSAYFDGAGDYLSLANNAAFQFGSGDFTIEFWFRPLTVSGGTGGIATLVALWGNTSNLSYVLYRANSGIQFSISSNGTTQINAVSVTSGVFTVNNWFHVAAVRAGSNIMLFVNGAQVGASYNIGTTALYASTNSLEIGYNSYAGYGPENGYIDELRLTKAARYLSDFPVPTDAFPDPT